MKVVLLLAIVLIGAAALIKYDRGRVIEAVVSRSASTGEPGALLLSGGALLGLAGAVRRYSL